MKVEETTAAARPRLTKEQIIDSLGYAETIRYSDREIDRTINADTIQGLARECRARGDEIAALRTELVETKRLFELHRISVAASMRSDEEETTG